MDTENKKSVRPDEERTDIKNDPPLSETDKALASTFINKLRERMQSEKLVDGTHEQEQSSPSPKSDDQCGW